MKVWALLPFGLTLASGQNRRSDSSCPTLRPGRRSPGRPAIRNPLAAICIALQAGLITVTTRPGATKPGPDVVPKRLVFSASQAFNLPFKQPAGVWYDTAHGEILLADAGNQRVVIFDESGVAKSQFTRKVRLKSGETRLGEPRRLAVNSAGEILIVDTHCDYVDVCDYRGRHLRRMEVREPSADGTGAGEPLRPTAVAVDYRDNVYIATATHVFLFNARGELQRAFGDKGTGAGEFLAITSLWVDTAGRIYVSDAQAMGVQIFSHEGEVLAVFGEHDAGPMNFSMPVGVVTDRRGRIWVADALRHIVSVFERDGKRVRFLDYIGAFGGGPGAFAYPSGLGSSLRGRLLVVDRVGARLQCFEF